MRKRVLYYCAFYETNEYLSIAEGGNKYTRVAFVMAQYVDGSIRYWYPEDTGFSSALYKAINRDTR